MVARFRLVMVGFGGGHLGVSWVSRWRSSLSHDGDRVFGSRWWRHGLNRLGLVLCFSGVDRRLVLWVDFSVLTVAKFQFHGGCWRRWVCCGGACNGNTKQAPN